MKKKILECIRSGIDIRGKGESMLRYSSRLVLRLESERIGEFLKLAGKRLDIDGCNLRVGIPEVRLLRPACFTLLAARHDQGIYGAGTVSGIS
jgi:hypothetical protein